MAKKSGSSFGNFTQTQVSAPNGVKPITTEFSRGSVPDSLYAVNRESAWTRWRRGYEIATATFYDNSYEYPFQYQIPVPAGTPSSVTNPAPIISGTFVGFPTKNKELGMHWAGWRYAGSMRSDNLSDPVTTDKLYIESITEDQTNWYVKLAGAWSPTNPLPPPFYVAIPGVPGGLTPLDSELIEDRVITPGGAIIDRDTIDPTTQKRYGYVQAVLTATNPFTGVLTLRKAGSVQVTPDKEFLTPSPIGFTPGRYIITGARFCCSCQDFTRRDFAFIRDLGKSNKRLFPRSSVSNIKPGRFELTRLDGEIDNSAMTSASVNRQMEVYAPSGYQLPFNVADSVVDNKATRDNPGIYSDFGATYTRSTVDPGIEGSKAEGMPKFGDYSSNQNVVTALTDNWEPLLDELRYCKHIYALKFADNTFPPEPSDFPVGRDNMADWEQRLVDQTGKEQESIKSSALNRFSLAQMDVPPYNCQSVMMMPMMQKLFNVPTDFIVMQGFTMFDKNGQPYVP
jgi:hypothetical protein